MCSALEGVVRFGLPCVLLLLLAGCVPSRSTGTVRGRVLSADGSPTTGVHVSMDSTGGPFGVSGAGGQFLIGNVAAGHHLVLAFDGAAQSGAAQDVDVEGGSTTIFDVVLQPCPPDPVNAGPLAEPCTAQAPPPPPTHLVFDTVEAASSWLDVDPAGVSGGGEDYGRGIQFGFWLAGDYTAASSASLHVSIADGLSPAGGLTLLTEQGGNWYFYELVDGDLAVTFTDDGDGDPATRAFSFEGAGLVFSYVDWYGGLDASHDAFAGTLAASGTAQALPAPPAPSGDTHLAAFSASWIDDEICGGCAPSSLLISDAFDAGAGVELRLYLPTSMLHVPGSVTVSGNSDPSYGSFGEAIVQDPDGGGAWYYRLVSATVQIGSSSLTPGDPLAMQLLGATFAWSGGTVGQQATLTIDSADLSTGVLGSGGVNAGAPL